MADVNGDGNPDIVGFAQSGVYVSIDTSTAGSVSFAAPVLVPNGSFWGTQTGGWSSQDLYTRELADINNDQIADIVGFAPNGVVTSISATVTDDNPANYFGDVPAIPTADLFVSKTVSDPTPNVGDTITFTVTLSDLGPDDATSVLVTDVLPAGLTLVSAIPSLGTYNAVTGLWDVGTVSPGGPQTLILTARVDSPAVLTNTGSISFADQFDPNTTNNAASVTETPQQADLLVLKTVSDSTPNVGDQIIFTVTLSDQGPDAATGVQVTDLLPAGLTFVSAITSLGTYDAVTGLWDVGTVSPGGSQTLFLTATVDSPDALTNTGTITDADQFDPDLTNNAASVTETPQVADLAITKTDGVDTVVPGTPANYAITVTNNGPSTVSSVTLTDTTTPALLNPAFGTSAGIYDPGTGIWSGLSLASGDSVSMSLTGTIDPTATGTLINTVTVAPPAGMTDTNTANNTFTDTDTLAPMLTSGVTNSSPDVALLSQYMAGSFATSSDGYGGTFITDTPLTTQPAWLTPPHA
jgi:uncharacterized repeat protein (TIGR01451 family)